MDPLLESEEKKVEDLVRETRACGGLAPVDLERFWADQDRAIQDPWGRDIPQVPLGAICTWECVFDELGVPEDHWRFQHDQEWRLSLCRQYNDRAEQIVGRRLLDETPDDPSLCYPSARQLHDLFEAENVWQANSFWLRESAHDEDELRALLDRVEARLEPGALRDFVLPPGWEREYDRLRQLGIAPPLYRSQRGPVTFATSIYGVERLIFLILDEPDLAIRFRDVILRAMLGLGAVLDETANWSLGQEPSSFYFCDDNCALLTPAMYELFGYPILEGVFEKYAPRDIDSRGQHSDSSMAHLLPLLGRLGLRSVNFGPTVSVLDIREHCPRAVIHGELAPFTYCRNEEENIVRELLRDFSACREQRGLVFATAGSINNGTLLVSMRLLMAAIQRYARYDG
jgi:uroporphyrinogen decarboxylase